MSNGGDRIGREEILRMLSSEPLGPLMARAHEARSIRWGDRRVTFVHDTNPNYTNLCVTGCRFCAFHRPPGHPEGFLLTPKELVARVAPAVERGATTVLLQGGHNPAVRWADWQGYIRAIRAACPGVHVHPFSPSEIRFMAGQEGWSVRGVLERLRTEGIDTIPGGGAEVLSDGARRRLSPDKGSAGDWLGVMEEAHRLGFRTTATLMFGHGESDGELADHLLALRELQDRTGGFSSFIPWSFKPGGSPLSELVPAGAHPARYVRILATARLALDNFPHVQSSWFSESVAAGQLGLLAGADDFGGLLEEENVLREAGYRRATTREAVLAIIRDAGFEPAQRDGHYRLVERLPERPEPPAPEAAP